MTDHYFNLILASKRWLIQESLVNLAGGMACYLNLPLEDAFQFNVSF